MNNTALVTGASSGIGLELARLFAGDGHDLVLVARSEGRLREIGEQLETAHGITATVVASDLSKPNAARDLVEALRAALIEIDVLVNNAGFGLSGAFIDNDPRTQLDMLQVNVVALTELTRLLLPPMVARRSGRILNVASTGLRAGAAGGRLRCHERVRAVVLRGHRRGVATQRCDRNRTVSRSHAERLQRGGGRRLDPPVRQAEADEQRRCRPRRPRGAAQRPAGGHHRPEEQAARAVGPHVPAPHGHHGRAQVVGERMSGQNTVLEVSR